MTILKQLTLRESIGTKMTGPFPATRLATFTASEISTLLAGTSPVPEGIRFHFEKNAANSTVGLIAVSLGVVAVPSAAGGTELHNRELTSGTKKYLRRNGDRTVSEDLEASEYQARFSTQQNKASATNGITNACVFFSRTDMQEILNQDGVTGIAFFPSSIVRAFTALPETYDTLLAVGISGAGTPSGIQIRSELPCPPHCGDDYPPD